MSPQGIMELWEALFEAGPEINGVVIDVNSDYELPPLYDSENLNDAHDLLAE